MTTMMTLTYAEALPLRRLRLMDNTGLYRPTEIIELPEWISDEPGHRARTEQSMRMRTQYSNLDDADAIVFYNKGYGFVYAMAAMPSDEDLAVLFEKLDVRFYNKGVR